MDDEIDIFESASGISHQHGDFDEDTGDFEVELEIEDENEEAHVEAAKLDIAPPPQKRRKLNQEDDNRPKSFQKASTIPQASIHRPPPPQKPSARDAAAASVSSLGLRSFFKTLAPGESLGSALAASEKKPLASPKVGQTISSPLQRNIFDAITQLGPISSIHLLGLLFGDTKDLSGEQRLVYKVHHLWGKCSSSNLYRKSPQDIHFAVNNLIENGFLVRDVDTGKLRCWNQLTPAPSSKETHQNLSRSAPASTVNVKREKIAKSNDKDHGDDSEDDKLTQFEAYDRGNGPVPVAAPSERIVMPTSIPKNKPWLQQAQKRSRVKREDPGAATAVKFVDPLSQARKVSSGPTSSGFLSGGAHTTAAPLPAHTHFALLAASTSGYPRAQDSFGPTSVGATSISREKNEPKEIEPIENFTQLQQILPLAPRDAQQPMASRIGQISAVRGAQQRTGFDHKSSNASVSTPALSLRPSFASGRSYTGGLEDVPSGAQHAAIDARRPVSGALPAIGRAQNSTRYFQSTNYDRTPKIDSIIASLRLSGEQLEIVKCALEGRSFFFTGAAGTGKSYVLRELVRALKDIHDPSSIFVTAPTGVAACNIAGSTVHSFSGIGLGQGSAEQIVARIFKNRSACARWHEAKVLIIDEISMLSGELFEKLEEAARKIRKNNTPFGGIQLIACGDFFQLPPVRDGQTPINFCFQVEAWKRVIRATYVLREVWRQKDQTFVELLSEIREGRLSEKHKMMLNQCVGRTFDVQISPTRLFARREDVASTNQQHLDNLPGQSLVFKAFDTEKYPNSSYLTTLRDNCPAPTVLTLKLNAQVILLKNLSTEDELVNGTRGVVVGWDHNDDPRDPLLPRILFDNGKTRTIGRTRYSTIVGQDELAAREMLPLNLAWALSIHKAQGMTISRLEIDLKRVWEDGQAYVALSRATSLDGLRLVHPVDPRVIRANQTVLEYYKSLS